MATRDLPPLRALMLPPGVQPNNAVFSSPLPKPLTWQSREHAIHRRTILAHIATLLAQTQRPNQTLPMTQTQSQNSWALARKLEVLLYLNSASLLEYSNLHSLQRRVQALTATIINRQIRKETQQPAPPPPQPMQPSMVATPTPMNISQLRPVAPQNRVEFASGVHHHVSQCHGLLRTPLDASSMAPLVPPRATLSSCHVLNHKRSREIYDHSAEELESKRPCQKQRAQPTELGNLLLRGCDEISKMLWSYVEGKEIFRCRILNRQARDLLPCFVSSLHLSCNAFQRALNTKIPLSTNPQQQQVSVLTKCVNLAQVDVISLSAGVNFGRKSMRAANCPQRFVVTHRDHEEIVLALAELLQPSRFPRLVHLGVTCLFTNEEANGEADVLLNALMTGCCPRLQELCLPGNSIGDYGAAKVADLLRSGACPQLKRLDLRKNFIGETGCQQVCHALADGCAPELTELCLGGNLITESGFQYVLNALERGQLAKLRYLGLEMNYLTANCFRRLGTCVGTLVCPQLNQISYSDNRVDDSEAKRIIAVAIYHERAKSLRRVQGASAQHPQDQAQADGNESEYYSSSDVTYYSQDEDEDVEERDDSTI